MPSHVRNQDWVQIIKSYCLLPIFLSVLFSAYRSLIFFFLLSLFWLLLWVWLYFTYYSLSVCVLMFYYYLFLQSYMYSNIFLEFINLLIKISLQDKFYKIWNLAKSINLHKGEYCNNKLQTFLHTHTHCLHLALYLGHSRWTNTFFGKICHLFLLGFVLLLKQSHRINLPRIYFLCYIVRKQSENDIFLVCEFSLNDQSDFFLSFSLWFYTLTVSLSFLSCLSPSLFLSLPFSFFTFSLSLIFLYILICLIYITF